MYVIEWGLFDHLLISFIKLVNGLDDKMTRRNFITKNQLFKKDKREVSRLKNVSSQCKVSCLKARTNNSKL